MFPSILLAKIKFPIRKETNGDYNRPVAYNPNDPPMPVAWTKGYQLPGGKKGKVFATTMGASTDLVASGTRRMLVNAVYWCTGLENEIPRDGANVNLVGNYKPSAYRFHNNAYWNKKAIRPSDFRIE